MFKTLFLGSVNSFIISVQIAWTRTTVSVYLLQWDVLLHVDWGGRQQEVRVLQTPAGKPLLNPHPVLSGDTLLSPVCCDRYVIWENVIYFSCGATDVLCDCPLRQQEREYIKQKRVTVCAKKTNRGDGPRGGPDTAQLYLLNTNPWKPTEGEMRQAEVKTESRSNKANIIKRMR